MSLFSLPLQTSLTDRFYTLCLGNTLLLKACGFIEDYHAEILEVDETFLRLRTGTHWMKALIRSFRIPRVLEIQLHISPPQDDRTQGSSLPRSRNSYCQIDVEIRPASPNWTHEAFLEEAKRMLCVLRSYFMAC
jgi:hypothetical protein